MYVLFNCFCFFFYLKVEYSRSYYSSPFKGLVTIELVEEKESLEVIENIVKKCTDVIKIYYFNHHK